MNLENEFTVPVPVDEAWRVLLDVERVAPCMPGATLTSVDGDEFTGTVKVKVGPITVTYKGEAKFLSKDDATHSAVIEAKGKESRGSGTAGATVTTTLVGEGARTKVRVTTDLNVTGRPAQFGRGVMAEVAAKLIDQFAKCLEGEINASPSPPTAVSSPDAPAAASSPDAPAAAVQAAAAATPVKKSAPAKKTAAASSATAKKTSATKKTEAAVPPPAGVTEAPPAPAAPLPKQESTVAPARADEPTVRPAAPAPRPPAEPIDLLDVAGGSIAKRLAPVAVVLLVLFILWRRRSR
ncbi:MAG TPA: SRPBCC family protein [Mycobacteriales bacterium]|nr:SRPBCC family protein [Mycobacteriales bacterium]